MTGAARAKLPGWSLFGRLRRMSGADRALLAEAFALLALSSAAIRLLPITSIGRLASRRLGRRRPASGDDLPVRVAWAVQACARRAPFRAVCFQQGLTAQIMLRRRGVESTLYFGAATGRSEGLAAHVWVRAGDRDVVGCEQAAGYAALATFPPTPGRPPRVAGARLERDRIDQIGL